MSEEMTGEDAGALLSQLRLIEDQPLDSRAAAFVQIHDRLQGALEGSAWDSSSRDALSPVPGKHV